MRIETLRWLQLVVDGATVTEIAELHMVSQPGVSRALDKLEAEIGTPLLVRSGRILRPTHAGLVFKQHLDAALHDIDDGLAAVSQLVDPETGSVAVAFHLSLGTWLLPDLVSSFRREHPRVRFRLADIEDAQGFSALTDGQVDLELSARQPTGAAVDWARLFTQPLVLAVPDEHRLLGRPEVSLTEVADDDFVMLRPSWELRGLVEQLCRNAGFSPRVAFEADDLSVAGGFVAAGLGIAVLPSSSVVPTRRGGAGTHYLRISDPGAHRGICLAWPKERRLLPSVDLFRRHVLRRCRETDFRGPFS